LYFRAKDQSCRYLQITNKTGKKATKGRRMQEALSLLQSLEKLQAMFLKKRTEPVAQEEVKPKLFLSRENHIEKQL
jgi:hypothetical protein